MANSKLAVEKARRVVWRNGKIEATRYLKSHHDVIADLYDEYGDGDEVQDGDEDEDQMEDEDQISRI